VEHGGNYLVETAYDEEADTRLRLRMRDLPSVDPIPPGHEHGKLLAEISGLKGAVDGDSSGTDGNEDEEGSDEHKLTRIRHAITGTSQPIQVILNGSYQWGQGWEEVSYCRTFKQRKIPEDIL
jgi:hypothetical protein